MDWTLKQSSCKGKNGYSTYSEAEHSVTNRRFRQFAHNVYRCKYCGYWHVGSVEPKTKTKKTLMKYADC